MSSFPLRRYKINMRSSDKSAIAGAALVFGTIIDFLVKALLLIMFLVVFFDHKVADFGRYKLVSSSNFFAWKIDTRTGEVWHCVGTECEEVK